MISPQEAFQSVVTACMPLLSRGLSLDKAVGLQLAEDISADCDYPAFNRAMMDGFAVRMADAGKSLPIVGEIPAGLEWTRPWPKGTCLEIMTGAACPPGVEAVVPKEQVQREGNTIVLPHEIAMGANITLRGSECRAGKKILSFGQSITPLAIAVAAAVGRTHLMAIPRPRLAILVTGEELASENEVPCGSKIHDSNGPMLVALTLAMGLPSPELVRAGDSEKAILSALERFDNFDIIVLSGGVSAGNYDFAPRVIQKWGGETLFHCVRQKPGKPLLFARRRQQIIFGLPGNPLACHFCFQRYVAAAIDVMQGKNPRCREFTGILSTAISGKAERSQFITAQFAIEPSIRDKWIVVPMPTVSSADIFSSTAANCFIEVPPNNEPCPAGSSLTCHRFVDY